MPCPASSVTLSPASSDDVGVVAGAAVHLVVAGAAVQAVVARAAGQRIVAVAAAQSVVAGAAIQLVLSVVARDELSRALPVPFTSPVASMTSCSRLAPSV